MAQPKKKKTGNVLTQEQRRRGGKASRAKYAYGKAETAAKKLDLAVKQTISILIKDVIAYGMYDPNDNGDDIKNRKAHIGLINQEIAAIKQMRDLADIMRDDAAKEATANIKENRDNIRLISEANKKLEEAGLKKIK